MPEFFTRAEADALLPRLRVLLSEIQVLVAEQAALAARLHVARAKVLGNGHSQQGDTHTIRDAIRARDEAFAARTQQIGALGVILKDPERGLVDFPTIRDGREVYLCWQLGEPRVAWWHEIEKGFAGRQPLDA